MFGSTEQEDLLSKRPCGQSIAELENLLESDCHEFQVPLPVELQRKISLAGGFTTMVSLVTSRASLVRIIDSVRTIVLTWALKLEEDGILGEGLSFTPVEKEAAKHAPQNITNFYGTVQNAQVQQGSNQSAQEMFVSMDVAGIRNFARKLRNELGNLGLSPQRRTEAEAEIRTVEAQTESPKPKPSIIREGLRSLEEILKESAKPVATTLLAELAKAMFGLS